MVMICSFGSRLVARACSVVLMGLYGMGPSRGGALRRSATGCCISVLKRIAGTGCSAMRGLISNWISDLALILRRGNVADLSVMEAVEVFTAPPAPPGDCGTSVPPGEAVELNMILWILLY